MLAAARTAFAVVSSIACLVAYGRASAAAEPAQLPNTAAGRCAAAYFDAFNTGNNEAMQAFSEKHYALSYLESHLLDRRSANYTRLRDIFGSLTPLRIAHRR